MITPELFMKMLTFEYTDPEKGKKYYNDHNLYKSFLSKFPDGIELNKRYLYILFNSLKDSEIMIFFSTIYKYMLKYHKEELRSIEITHGIDFKEFQERWKIILDIGYDLIEKLGSSYCPGKMSLTISRNRGHINRLICESIESSIAEFFDHCGEAIMDVLNSSNKKKQLNITKMYAVKRICNGEYTWLTKDYNDSFYWCSSVAEKFLFKEKPNLEDERFDRIASYEGKRVIKEVYVFECGDGFIFREVRT